MSDYNTLGEMLRDHQVDEDLPFILAPAMTREMLKTSDLHAAYGEEAQKLPAADFLQPEKYGTMEGKKAELARDAAAFLAGHDKTLIHDGLSADQVLLSEEKPEVQTSETCYRGPFGYDLASLMVSGVLAFVHGNALIEDASDREDYCDCTLDLISNLADQMIGGYDTLFDELADAPKAKEEEFKRSYFEKMMPDLSAAAGLETLRVLLGERPSEELKEIADGDKRKEAEAILLTFAEICIKERDTFYFGADFAAALERAAREIS